MLQRIAGLRSVIPHHPQPAFRYRNVEWLPGHRILDAVLSVDICLDQWMAIDGDPLLRMLRPWTSMFWMGNSLSNHNYETNWFDLVKEGRIVVHHADV